MMNKLLPLCFAAVLLAATDNPAFGKPAAKKPGDA
jgi:hypothetical protein